MCSERSDLGGRHMMFRYEGRVAYGENRLGGYWKHLRIDQNLSASDLCEGGQGHNVWTRYFGFAGVEVTERGRSQDSIPAGSASRAIHYARIPIKRICDSGIAGRCPFCGRCWTGWSILNTVWRIG